MMSRGRSSRAAGDRFAMNILVTGGTGFIGKHVVDELLATTPAKIRLLTRQSAPSTSRLEYVRGDIRDRELLQGMIKDCEYVVHLANSKKGREQFHPVNVDGTEHVIDGCRASPSFKRLIHLSSVGVIGNGGGARVDEQTPCQPGNDYDKTKYQAELLVRRFSTEHPGRAVILRPTNVFGEEDPELHLLNLFRKVKRGHFYFLGKGESDYHVNYLYVKELSGLIGPLLQRDPPGDLYIVNTPSRLVEFIADVKSIVGSRHADKRLPLWPVMVAAKLFDAIPKSLMRHPPVNSLKVGELTNPQVFSAGLLADDLAWKPKDSVGSALAKLYAHYVSKGLIG